LIAPCAVRADAALLLRQSPADEAAFDLAVERMGVCPIETPLVAIPLGGASSRARLSALLRGEREFSRRQVTICAPETGDSVSEAVSAVLPNVARLEFARLTGAKGAQAQIAASLLKSFTAVCGVIGLNRSSGGYADPPICRPWSASHLLRENLSANREFSALGLVIGAGILRGSLARLSSCSCLGNAVSGMVVGANLCRWPRRIAYLLKTSLSESETLQRLFRGWDALNAAARPT
jgi:hypothetical protein